MNAEDDTPTRGGAVGETRAARKEDPPTQDEIDDLRGESRLAPTLVLLVLMRLSGWPRVCFHTRLSRKAEREGCPGSELGAI